MQAPQALPLPAPQVCYGIPSSTKLLSKIVISISLVLCSSGDVSLQLSELQLSFNSVLPKIQELSQLQLSFNSVLPKIQELLTDVESENFYVGT
jgi:hypothetical protein